MRHSLLAAHDVGTNGDKCVICDERGVVLGSSYYQYAVDYPKPSWAEQRPELWWRAICSTTKSLLKKLRISGNEISALSFSAQMAGMLPVDKNGRPLRACMIWLDGRSVDEADWILRRIDRNHIYDTSGCVLTAKDVLPKILWLKRHESRVYSRAHKFLDVKDFIEFLLTGEYVTDYSCASYTSLFDIRRRVWSEEIAACIDLSTDKLSMPVPSTEVVGEISTGASKEIGIAAGTPVVAGGGDDMLASIGAGAVDVGECHLCLGTSGWVGVNLDHVVLDPSMRYVTLCHVIPSQWMIYAGMDCAGASLNWFEKALGSPEVDAPTARNQPYRVLDSLASSVGPGSEGLLFLPYLIGERSPIMNTRTRGAFIGLSTRHTKAHLVRAILEGVALNLAWIVESIEESGVPVRPLRAIGGGSISDIWLQIIANATNLVVSRVTKPREAGTIGAAIVAAVGVKVLKDFQQTKRFVHIEKDFRPEPSQVRLYQNLLPLFRAAYQNLVDVLSDLYKMS